MDDLLVGRDDGSGLRGAAGDGRRAEVGELSDNELYTSDAQWCGIYDRLEIRTPDEIQRRTELAAEYRKFQESNG